MRGPTPVICDHCQVNKGQGNHWYIIEKYPEKEIRIIPFELGFGEPPAHREEFFDVCGEHCLLKEVSRLINPQDFPGDPIKDCEV